MLKSAIPCLSLAIARLSHTPTGSDHFAIWVLNAPYPGGYVIHDCHWTETLTQSWRSWQEMFSLRGLPQVPRVYHAAPTLNPPMAVVEPVSVGSSPTSLKSSRLMQELGIQLWQWLFSGAIDNSLAQSQGIAIGQKTPLRLRLEVREPDLIALPWEIMQSQAGKQAISLSQQILFSRTTSDVDPLPPQRYDQALNILLVLGQDVEQGNGTSLQLQTEADALGELLMGNPGQTMGQGVDPQRLYPILATPSAPIRVDTLIQPSAAELIEHLETERYNVLFYSGHGVPGPDGGMLFLRPNATLNGTELAQVLVRCRVTLAVFNACWGAQPEQNDQGFLPRSSLAEVLIHQGVPAVLGMRDSIADEEALSFIQAFAQALAAAMPIDQAVAVARQQLLTLYKFNKPAWTLPVLYMHPEFDGELIRAIGEGITELPGLSSTWMNRSQTAALRCVDDRSQVWPIRGGLMRVGRLPDNDLVIPERWVSQKHAEIICRDFFTGENSRPTYYLRDFSRFGTLILGPEGWQKVHHQEIPLQSGVRLKFGSSQGQTLEFVVEG